jgi:6-pyruvoyltetrahydropterin/6-carboxytetrahydropterin synthase
MPRFIITKEFTFEAAHRLFRNYTGKCTNNHGHSFKIKLHIEGNELDDKDMLMDFQETKKLKSWVEENFDHVTILWEKDPMIQHMAELQNKVFITKKNPTSEHIAEIILEKAMQLFNSEKVKVNCIEVNETCTTGARIFP